MSFDFDTVINRKNTDCLKYDFATRRGKPEDVLPLWVADMDFQTAPCILNALSQRVNHGIFGYTESGDSYAEAIQNWCKTRYHYEVQPNWIVKTPSVVFAVAMAIQGLTEPGDSVMLQQPGYHPFPPLIKQNHRNLVLNNLKLVNNRFEIDFELFEKQIIDNKVKLFIFVSPHNPVGRVWTQNELEIVGEICLKHNVYILSDEIHADFIFPGYQFISFLQLNPKFENILMISTSPSKTFNVPGLQLANTFIPNKEIKKKFIESINQAGYHQPNAMGLIACEAAYREGGEWLNQLLLYLEKNIQFLKEFISINLPKVKLVEPEGTYLLFLNFREYGLSDKELDETITFKAKVWVNSGISFGEPGSGFIRINIACPLQTLKEALTRISTAFSSL